jgi:ribosomal protein S4
MRSYNKYKKLQYIKKITFSFPIRTKNFKRTKWKQLQKKILFLSKCKPKIYNILQRRHLYKKWKKLQFSFKNSLNLKISVFRLFQNHLNNKLFNKSLFIKKCSNLEFFSNVLAKNEFRIDLLLWKLHLFESSYAARLAINNNYIHVNSKTISGNFYLKKGDIVSFNKSFNLKKNLKNLIQYKYLLTFIEIDYYSNTIIILKSYSNLNLEDFFLLNYKFFDLSQLRFL